MKVGCVTLSTEESSMEFLCPPNPPEFRGQLHRSSGRRIISNPSTKFDRSSFASPSLCLHRLAFCFLCRQQQVVLLAMKELPLSLLTLSVSYPVKKGEISRGISQETEREGVREGSSFFLQIRDAVVSSLHLPPLR